LLKQQGHAFLSRKQVRLLRVLPEAALMPSLADEGVGDMARDIANSEANTAS
jgi:hypothetical protein